MKQNIDICEFLSDGLIFFILTPMSEGKTVSHLQIQDSGAKILYFITILKIIGFLKLERNDIDVSIIFLEVHVILMIYCLAIF